MSEIFDRVVCWKKRSSSIFLFAVGTYIVIVLEIIGFLFENMFKTTNPLTGEEMELPEGTQLNEIITADDGTMFEVIELDTDNSKARLEKIEVEEDWGE